MGEVSPTPEARIESEGESEGELTLEQKDGREDLVAHPRREVGLRRRPHASVLGYEMLLSPN